MICIMRFLGFLSIPGLAVCLVMEMLMLPNMDMNRTRPVPSTTENTIQKLVELEANYSAIYTHGRLWEKLYHKANAENFKLLVEKLLPPKLSIDATRARSLIRHLGNIYAIKRSMEFLIDSAVLYDPSKLEELYEEFRIIEREDADDKFRMCMWSLLKPSLKMHSGIKEFCQLNNLTECEFCYSIMEAYAYIYAEIYSGRILLLFPSDGSETTVINFENTVEKLHGLSGYQQLAVKLLYKAFKSGGSDIIVPSVSTKKAETRKYCRVCRPY